VLEHLSSKTGIGLTALTVLFRKKLIGYIVSGIIYNDIDRHFAPD
jgi:hypothetical protein